VVQEVQLSGNTAQDSQAAAAEDAQRIVIKNAQLSIVVANPAATMDAITRMAESMGGFVVTSNLYQLLLDNDLEVPQADITIRVPAARLTEALEQIKSGAGEVLSENVSGEDVTREYTDLKSRLRNLEDAEAQLREIMASATKTEDVLAVFNQLTYVREQIEVTRGQIQYYEQASALSAIEVRIQSEETVKPLTIGAWQPVGVARDAIQALVDTFKVLVNIAIWIVLYILPVGLLIFIPLRLLWLGFRRLRRKPAAPPPTPPAPKAE
jgi:hypothetical protein